MEKGVLFSKAGKSVREPRKEFCFAEVQESALWDGEDRPEVTHEQALELDAILQNIILKYF